MGFNRQFFEFLFQQLMDMPLEAATPVDGLGFMRKVAEQRRNQEGAFGFRPDIFTDVWTTMAAIDQEQRRRGVSRVFGHSYDSAGISEAELDEWTTSGQAYAQMCDDFANQPVIVSLLIKLWATPAGCTPEELLPIAAADLGPGASERDIDDHLDMALAILEDDGRARLDLESGRFLASLAAVE